MEEKIKLTETDLKLLSYLYHHNREPLTKIAKATKLTRQQVEYRINNYVKSGLIRQFATMINYSALGLNKFAVLFIKAEKYEFVENIKEKLRNNKNCIAFGELQGEYDLYVDLICKDEADLTRCVRNITESSKTISDYFLINPYFAEMYPIKFADKKHDKPFVLVNEEVKNIILNYKEKQILKILATDSRISLVNLYKKSGVSPEMAFHIIKKLQKLGVIQGTKLMFNMALLGYSYTAILFNVTGHSDQLQREIKDFCNKHPLVNSLGLSVNKPNCFIQVFHKTNEELRTTIQDLKKLLSKNYVEYKILNVLEEERVNTLPLLD